MSDDRPFRTIALQRKLIVAMVSAMDVSDYKDRLKVLADEMVREPGTLGALADAFEATGSDASARQVRDILAVAQEHGRA